jgi:hypothetical protein
VKGRRMEKVGFIIAQLLSLGKVVGEGGAMRNGWGVTKVIGGMGAEVVNWVTIDELLEEDEDEEEESLFW